MLLAVGGGFFSSSSASGYSKGLTLLLLGHKNEEKPMRVTPWTRYQLVDQKTDPAILQLAPGKNHLVRGCATFVCFGRAAAGPEGPSPPRVGPAQNQEVLSGPPLDFDDESKNPFNDGNGDDRNRVIGIRLKSNLKKSVNIAPVTGEIDNNVTCQIEKKKVQWTDAIGKELFEVREFETSEGGSDDELDHENGKTCTCRIM